MRAGVRTKPNASRRRMRRTPARPAARPRRGRPCQARRAEAACPRAWRPSSRSSGRTSTSTHAPPMLLTLRPCLASSGPPARRVRAWWTPARCPG
eukprot:364076-Chlamydomonas_euryale.AAC.3